MNSSVKNLSALFLQQSLLDAEADYERSLKNKDFPHFDVIALTASNEHQAEAFRQQLATRQLPPGTEFVVIPDKDGQRVGSGGATLSVIKYVREKYGSFRGLNVACIHSGGDSKRTPNYSALGKLFSPVPRVLRNGRPSTLFDEFMIAIASVPGRMREGMLLLSGDVLLLFNPLQIDYSGHGAAAISFKEDAETGKNHGVFLKGRDGNVRRFLHKQTVETLTQVGAVNERGKVAIDTGAVIFGPDMLESLYSLVADEQGEKDYINSVTRLSLYGDFLYPLATDSTLEDFHNEKPEGEFCEELRNARTHVWEALRPYRMKLLNLAPARFIHFGTTREVLALMDHGVRDYEALGWSRCVASSLDGGTEATGEAAGKSSASDFTGSCEDGPVAGYSSVLENGAKVGEGSYLEVSYVHAEAEVGRNCLISFVDLHDEQIPDDAVVHGLKQADGRFVCRIYGSSDNPKTDVFFGRSLSQAAKEAGIPEEQLWQEGEAHVLWTARLYPACDTIREAVGQSLKVARLLNGEPNHPGQSNPGQSNPAQSHSALLEEFLAAPRKSLCSGFNEADSAAIIDWLARMDELTRMDEVAKLIRRGEPADKAAAILKADYLTPIQVEWLNRELKDLDPQKLEDFSYGMRLYLYLGKGLGDDRYLASCFKYIADTILQDTLSNLQYNDQAQIVRDEVVIQLPLRVNWGGGWSDTAPHCLEQGGLVLNAAISLNGELPVEVRMVRIPEKKIVFDSRDMDVHGEFTEIEPLQRTGDPFDPFALQKACLLASGVLPKEGGSLEQILTRLGGGFEMHSEVTNVPKGSGLGTSSILSAACVKAVFEFLGLSYTEDELYAHVVAMEQIMSTGGGWQDQVGGVTPGIKLIGSQPGITQQLTVEHIDISEDTKQQLAERFCLIYTGQRRLARNLLRDVVGRYVGNVPESLEAHKAICDLAKDMTLALQQGDVDGFAKLLERHWTMSQRIDHGSTNTLIDQIFLAIDDLIDARMVVGAGGGGFLQVILKKGVTHQAVHERLKEIFQDFEVDVWPCSIVF